MGTKKAEQNKIVQLVAEKNPEIQSLVSASYGTELEEAPIIEKEGEIPPMLSEGDLENQWNETPIKLESKKMTRNVKSLLTIEDVKNLVEQVKSGNSHKYTVTTSLVCKLVLDYFFDNVYKGSINGINVLNGGLYYNNRMGAFPNNALQNGIWYQFTLDGIEDIFYMTFVVTMEYGETVYAIHLSSKHQYKSQQNFTTILNYIKQVCFSFSEYKGKTIEVTIKDSSFKNIEIVNLEANENDLILTDLQLDFIRDFVNRVKRGKNMRGLLNGIPGTGKSETIREIARQLDGIATFIIPKFNVQSDLTMIMEACTIFDSCVIILDDMDLLISSRERGGNPKALGEFLAFFDGIKKNPISLLASTNDKALVDKAAERPGRFNQTIDYDYLNDEQIVKVCNVHLPKEYQVDDIYNVMKGQINGKKAKITGAFIANLAENLIEMCEDEDDWTLEDTKKLIINSYKGFYASQNVAEKSSLGFGK